MHSPPAYVSSRRWPGGRQVGARRLFCLLVVAAAALTVQAAILLARTAIFPAVTADVMDRTTIALPSQLAGTENLLLLSWSRRQQDRVESWTAAGQALEHMHPGTCVYTVLVSPRENPLFRWWDNASLRASQTDPDLLHFTLALYTNEAALQRALNISDQKEMTVLLIDRAGHVLWHARGASTAKSRASLLAAGSAPAPR